MPEGGTLTLATETRVLEPGAQPLVPGEPLGEYVRLTVSDEGEGMDETTRRRIFEPFYTTKDVGEGTGLGLAVVFSVVREHDGVISVESAPGGGTRFSIDLPMTRSSAVQPDDVPSSGSVEGRGETVLIVDDEEPLRVLVASALERAGYRTLVAGGGRDALAVYRRCASDVSMVLLDVVMPEMNGYDTYLALLEMEPSLPVLFSTGFERDVFPPGFFEEGAHALLRKPYDIATLLRSVRAVLDADPPG